MPNETIENVATVFPIDPEILKPHSKLKRTGSIIKEFGLNTSTHGIPSIARSETILNRIFWSISTFIFASIMTYFIVEAIIAYFQYPSQTSVSVIVEWPQAFPAVTICNYCPLRYDRFIGPYLNYLRMFNLTNITDINNLINITDINNFTYEQSLYIRDFLTYKLNQNETLYEYFYSLDIMLMSCNYNGISCSSANFTWFASASFGFCYTFNAKLKNAANDGIRYSSDNGGYGLLELRLYAHQQLYVPYLSYGTGMVAMVHDNVQVPSVEMAGMLIGPGQHHRMSYTKQTSSFLSAPYTDCNDKLNLGMQAKLDQYNGTDYGYSQTECYFACIQAYTYQKCGCGNPFRWANRAVLLPGADKTIDIPFCAINDPCYIPAASELMNIQSIQNTYCPDCTQECSTSDFTIKSSSLLAPPAYLMNDIAQFVESTNVPLPANWSTSWMTDIQSSYLSFEVSYETTRTEVYTEQATLSPVDVVSNIGGQTGLWIGISFLSLIEIVEMVYRLVHYQCHSIRKGIKKRFQTLKITEQLLP